MKVFMKFMAVALMLLGATFSFAQETQLKVATGSSSGTYSRMFKEFQGVCKNQILQTEVNTSGSIDNVDKLLGNEVNAAFVQTDVLFYRARTEDLTGVKTLFALHPEEVHVVTLTTSKIQEGGVVGIGSKPIQLNTVSDLTGRKVVSWGGSYVTAQVIRLQAELNFNIEQVADFKAAKAALDSGAAAAIVMVGGHPMADVASLNNQYKLLPFPEAVVGKLKAVYVPARLTYSAMGAGGAGVQTVATEALYVTRKYTTPKMTNALSSLRECFQTNAAELSETIGTHKKWSVVKTDNQGKWSYYELPVVKKTGK